MRNTGIQGIAKDVNERLTSAERIARETVARADAYHEIQPAAWISRVPQEQLYAQARQIDQRIARGESLPLAGVPVAVKDNIDVAGMETTAACPHFSYRAEVSAPVIERLIEAGAIVVGKTNLDQFATGLVGTRSPYGSLGCVFNREFISGGSSSGSAVLVAAGVVPLALGSDTAGSGRVPAAFNHLVGFKPTRGRWSSRGLVPACRSLDCISTFTTNAEEAALIDQIVAGFDSQDAYSRRSPTQPTPALRRTFRLGVPTPGQLQDLAPPDIQAYSTAVGRLIRTGGSPLEVDVSPLLEAARLLYEGPWVAERTAALESLLDSHPEAIHPTVCTILKAGQAITGVETFRGLHALQGYARRTEALWRCIDVLALPATPTIYRRTEVIANPYTLNAHLGCYTNFVNLLDMCAVAVPAGFRENSTGVGLSLIGPAWADAQLLELAARCERLAPHYEIPKLDTGPNPSRLHLAVVGAHLSGMPLHSQLTSREARLVQRTHTAPLYRLFALQGETPPKPGLVRVSEGGGPIELEVYELEASAFSSFEAQVRPPLAIGTVTLQDGTQVRGFVCEPRALQGALDITRFGGWRAYLAHSASSPS